MSEPYRLRAARPTTKTSAVETLGPVTRTFGPASSRRVAWAVFPFVLLLAYLVWLASQGELSRWFSSGFSAMTVTALFVLAVALIVYTAAGGGAEVIRMHTNGLLDLRSGRAVRWDETLSLTDVWDAQRKQLAGCVLRTTDGGTLMLGPTIGGVQELAEELRVRMSDLKLPAMLERLDAGAELHFGVLVARGEGIAQGDRLLPWGAVALPLVERGAFVLRDTSDGLATWAAVPLRDVPNAFLLAEIIEKRRG